MLFDILFFITQTIHTDESLDKNYCAFVPLQCGGFLITF